MSQVLFFFWFGREHRRPGQWRWEKQNIHCDWCLRKGDSRDKMGEWLKKATVRSQDQRRMFQANTHSFPSNYWWNKITRGKESNKCDLCRVLWISEGRFNTEDELPIQTLGHMQHQCESLPELHTLAQYRYWCIIHTEWGRLASSEWRFICINGERTLKTIWNELEAEFPEILTLTSNVAAPAGTLFCNLITIFSPEFLEGVYSVHRY